jgi:succinyl-CoA:acetate CoA-transferase
MLSERIRLASLHDKVVSAEEAADLIQDGMIIGMSGFTRAGEAKAVPMALAERAKREPMQITLMTGASLGNDLDKTFAEAHLVSRRMPFQSDPGMRKAINAGEVMFIDQHLSETVEMLRSNQLGPIDYAIIEAIAITENGAIVPTTSVGNSATFAILSKKVIVEINVNQTLDLEGVHDVYIPTRRPHREPIPVLQPDDRHGTPYIPIPPEKIAAIVMTGKRDSSSNILPPDAETKAIADHLIRFFEGEVAKGRLGYNLQPLQAGIGTIANAVLHGFIDSPFRDLTMYSEVLQDSTFQLLDSGKMLFASGASMTLSKEMEEKVLPNFAAYRDRLVLRPQEISNHPEVIRRLGIIAINTALEVDIYGNVNSTHVNATHMMNGIGGSGDFARNAYLSIFVTKSIAKGGDISSIVPFVTHVDHCEHDVDLIVTEQGLADLRGLAPRERARLIIETCTHPDYRPALQAYFDEAKTRGGQTPHILESVFAWHLAYRDKGTMKAAF